MLPAHGDTGRIGCAAQVPESGPDAIAHGVQPEDGGQVEILKKEQLQSVSCAPSACQYFNDKYSVSNST